MWLWCQYVLKLWAYTIIIWRIKNCPQGPGDLMTIFSLLVSLLLWHLRACKVCFKLFGGHLGVEIPGLSWYMGMTAFALLQPFQTAFQPQDGLDADLSCVGNKTDWTQVVPLLAGKTASNYSALLLSPITWLSQTWLESLEASLLLRCFLYLLGMPFRKVLH